MLVKNKTKNNAMAGLVFTSLLLVMMIISFAIVGFSTTLSLKQIYIVYALLAIGVYFCIFITAPKKVNNHFNLYLIFMSLTIPFYWGGQLLVLLGFYEKLSFERYSLVDGRIENEYIIQAMQFVLISLLIIHLSYLFFTFISHKHDFSFIKHESNPLFRKKLYKISSVILAVVLIPTFARLTYDVIMARVYGHLVSFTMRGEEEYLGIWYVFSYLSGWFLPVSYLVLITSDKKKIDFFIYFLLLMYCVLYLLCGSRYQIIEVVVAVAIILFYVKNVRLNSKKILAVLVFVITLLIILRSVSYTRDSTGSGLSLQSVFDVISGGFLYETLFETSTTFVSIANLFKYCPSYYLDFNYGLSIVGSLFYMLPAFLRPDVDIILHISPILSPLYHGYTESGYGSSFLTEAYFNYSYFAYFFLFIFGFVLFLIVDCINNITNKKCNYFLIGISVYLFTQLVWGIRSDLYLIPRHLLYYIVLPCLMAKLMVGFRKNERHQHSFNFL